MEWKDLAPWITIAFTLALSILVPLFTQIANNRHQRKMQREKIEFEQSQKRIVVYEAFLKNVGAAITNRARESLASAGSSVSNMYIYAPSEWLDDLDRILDYMRNYEWDQAASVMKKINRLISEELKKK